MSIFDRHFIPVNCPSCNYPVDVQFLSLRLEEVIFCPCCKASIRLHDETASAFGADKEISNALTSLSDSLKDLGGTITLEF